MREFFRKLVNMFLGQPCDKCGCRGASLVIDAVPAGKRIDGKTGLITKTYAVKSADWLCAKCR